MYEQVRQLTARWHVFQGHRQYVFFVLNDALTTNRVTPPVMPMIRIPTTQLHRTHICNRTHVIKTFYVISKSIPDNTMYLFWIVWINIAYFELLKSMQCNGHSSTQFKCVFTSVFTGENIRGTPKGFPRGFAKNSQGFPKGISPEFPRVSQGNFPL